MMPLARTFCFIGVMLTPLMASADALDQWTTRTSPVPVVLADIIYGNNRFVAIGTDTNTGVPRLIVSSNGMDWNRFASFAQFTPRSLTYGSNGLFVGVGRANLFDLVGNPGVIVSTNGTNWSYFPTFGNAFVKTNFEGVAYGQGQFIAVGEQGIVATSINGTNWATHATPTLFQLTGVAYGNGVWVAVGPKAPEGGTIPDGDGPLLTSLDGTNWVQQNSAFNATRVLYARGLFVAIAGDTFTTNFAPIRISADGTNWLAVNDSTTHLYRRLTYGGGTFVAVAYGATKVSFDATNWVRRAAFPAITNRLFSVAYGSNTFVAVGDGILQSGDVRPTLRIAKVPDLFGGLGPDGKVYLRGLSNAAYVLEVSTNFTFWLPRSGPHVATGAEDPIYQFSFGSTNRFYRATQVP